MIKHILADGTELKNIEGRMIPPTGNTEAVYRLIAEYMIRHCPLEKVAISSTGNTQINLV